MHALFACLADRVRSALLPPTAYKRGYLQKPPLIALVQPQVLAAVAMMDSSPTRPAKRRRPGPVIVENPETSKAVSFSTRMVTSSSDLQREPSRRRILRDISTQKRGNQRPATRRADGKKVEVVIINQKETAAREERPQPVREPVEMQVHRTMERRRPRQRESAGAFGNKKIVREPTRPRTIIPYSEDSDDELSFL